MVRLVAATVVSSHFAFAKDDMILLQMRSLSSLEAGTESSALTTMTESMKDLLLGEPDVMKRTATANFVTGMEDEISSMKAALRAQNKADNGDVAVKVAAINACNTARQTAWDAADTGVTALDAKVDDWIQSHRACREQEVIDVGDENAKCELKRDRSTEYKSELTTCLTNAGAVSEKIALCLDKTCAQDTAMNTAIADCSAAVGVSNTKETECDGEQSSLEGAFCLAASHVVSTCSTHSSCYAEATNDYTALQTKFTGKLASQQEMWKSINHIECLFGLFKTGAQVTAGEVTTCLNTDVATIFSLDYPAADLEDNCDQSRSIWNPAAYTGLEGIATRQQEDQDLTAIGTDAQCVGDYS